jgi:hypothetical protein
MPLQSKFRETEEGERAFLWQMKENDQKIGEKSKQLKEVARLCDNYMKFVCDSTSHIMFRRTHSKCKALDDMHKAIIQVIATDLNK